MYSFGILLWQMYTGSRPWSGLTHSQIIMLIGSGVSTQHGQELCTCRLLTATGFRGARSP